MSSNSKIPKQKSFKLHAIIQFLIATIVTFGCLYYIVEMITPPQTTTSIHSSQHSKSLPNPPPSSSSRISPTITSSSYKTPPAPPPTTINSVFSSKHICKGDNIAAYSNTNNNFTNNHMATDIQWCRDAVRKNGVEIGRSWGSLSRESRTKWDQINCNE